MNSSTANPSSSSSSIPNRSNYNSSDNSQQPDSTTKKEEDDEEEGYIKTAAQNYGKKLVMGTPHSSSVVIMLFCHNILQSVTSL